MERVVVTEAPLSYNCIHCAFANPLRLSESVLCKYCSRCRCGKCSMELLANAQECRCCTEVEVCMPAISNSEVVEDVGHVSCVTNHPGFNAVCLSKWSLRLSGEKYKRKGGQRYHQFGYENK